MENCFKETLQNSMNTMFRVTIFSRMSHFWTNQQ